MASRIYTTKRKRPLLGPILTIFALLLIGVGVYAARILFEQASPIISLEATPEYIGHEAILSITVTDQGLGLQEIMATVSQGQKVKELYSQNYTREGYTGKAGPDHHQRTVVLIPGQLDLTDGEAVITIQARDFSFRHLLKGNTTQLSRTIIIDSTPPQIELVHTSRTLKPGSAGLVIYRVSEDAVSHGVVIDGNFHPGFPVSNGRKGTQNALIGLPYDAPAINESMLVARDQAGNIINKPVQITYQAIPEKHDQISVGDNFLNQKIPEFEQHYPEMTGDPVAKYLYANREIRQANNQTIHDLCAQPTAERMWSGRFLRMAGATRAKFADRRTYLYNNQPIDQQTHLGMDLASTQNANIKAAGAGRVIFTDYLGIYGKMVMLDHGQGLFSLYSHMSQIKVAVGDKVDQGYIIGNTGTTGMAGGDHLHFSILINGIFVTPLEWWDQRWIDLTIEEPLVDSKF